MSVRFDRSSNIIFEQDGYEIQKIVAYTLVSLLVGFAWVACYLDKYQSKAQEVLLDKMGENKVSHGLKSKN